MAAELQGLGKASRAVDVQVDRDYQIELVLKGGTAAENARLIRSILEGVRSPARDITVLNAAAAIVIAGEAAGFDEGIAIAERSIDSRKALEKLEMLRIVSNSI